MENKKFGEQIFARAARTNKFLNSDLLIDDGLTHFKRKALGFLRRSKVRNLDEMAKLFYETNIANSIEEGRELTLSIPRIERIFRYGAFNRNSGLSNRPYPFVWEALEFEILKNRQGEADYKISTYSDWSSGSCDS